MKRKIAAVLTAAMTAAGLTGCLDSGKSSSVAVTDSVVATADGGSEVQTAAPADDDGEISESMELMRIKYADVPDLESGPVLSLSNTTAKPGEMAEVTVSVSGADQQWNMCGIHFTYPDVLECKIANDEDLEADYEPGAAISANAGFVAMDWQRNLSDELVRNHQRSVFFTTMFINNSGKDGDIATFFFKIPEDAQPGTVYDLGFYYMDSDMFSNSESDPAFEKYAFEHMQGGSITVR